MNIDDFLDTVQDTQGVEDKNKKATPVDIVQDANEIVKEHSLHEIHDFLGKFQKSIQDGNFEQASILYDSFHKVSMSATKHMKHHNDILDKFEQLNTEFQQKIVDHQKIATQVKERVHILLQDGGLLLKQNKHEHAMQVYTKLQELLHSMAPELDETKLMLEQQVIKFYFSLITFRLKYEKDLIDQLCFKIQVIVDKGYHYLQQADYTHARVAYEEAVALYESMPKGFLEDKSKVYHKMMLLLKEINISDEIALLQNKLTIQKSAGIAQHVHASQVQHSLPRQVPQQHASVQATNSAPDKNTVQQNVHLQKVTKPFNSQLTPEIVRVRQSLARAKVLRAQYEISLGNFSVAQQHLHKALDLDSHNVEAQRLLQKVQNNE